MRILPTNSLKKCFYLLLFLDFLLVCVCGDPIDDAFMEALHEVNRLYNKTEPMLFEKFELSTHMPYARNAWLAHTFSSLKAKNNAFGGYVLSRTTQILKRSSASLPSGWAKQSLVTTGVCGPAPEECDQSTTAYRTYDGTCNNVRKPTMGSTFTALRRELPADYSDGVSELRHSAVSPNDALPNPRQLSNVFFNGKVKGDGRVDGLSAMFVHWGMFTFTDMVHLGSVQLIQGEKHVPLPCCESDHPECRPITVHTTDPLYGGFVACLDYPRTLVAPSSTCSLGPREQANQATSYLDASQLYGSTKERADSLRTFRDGKMKVSSDVNHLNSMPLNIEKPFGNNQMTCPDGASCFLSGSEHTNFLPTLVALHTLWLRQHNRIAQILMNQNKAWSDEQLYQEARRIVIAQIQHITYNEFLPLLIGRETWKKNGMHPNEEAIPPKATANDDAYNLKIDPTVMNVYASVVGQFFYTMLGDKIAQYHSEGYRTMERPLSDYINKPKLFLFGEDIDGILRFLLRDRPEPFGLHMPADVRGRLFKGTTNMGLDLATMLLQTGRDHGIPAYVHWRKHCGGSHVEDFEDLRDDLMGSDELIPLLKKYYKSVRDVDLLILGLAERPERGAVVGPTFACLMAKQFAHTKQGDRFWYENTVASWGFTKEQLEELRKVSLAQVICENSGVALIQPHAFRAADKKDNFPLLCNITSSLRQNFEPWRDVEPQVEMPVTMNTVRKAIEIGMNVVMERRKREAKNIKQNQGKFGEHDPIYSYGQMMRAKREAVHQSKISSVLLEATRALMFNQSLMDGSPLGIRLDSHTLQKLLPQIDVSEFVGNIGPFMGADGTVEQCLPQELPCDHTSPYRTYSGWCNNLRYPHYGNAFGPLRHLFMPEYADGIDAPRSKSVTGDDLPMAREVSNAMHSDQAFDDEQFTHMVMQFGQFVDHEVTHSPVERGPRDEILNCTRCDSPDTLSIHCMPLHIPEDDPMHPTHDVRGERRCFPMARSLLGQLALGYRNQLNQLTAYLDASVIYGSTQCEASALRLFDGGLMNFTDIGEHNREALPQGDQEQDCRSKPRYPCFVAGDERNSHQPGLTTMHTLWMREHNRLARALKIMNPEWNDEKLYQETKRIVGAMLQHIIYNEFIPKLIGKRFMEKYALEPQKNGYFEAYDSTCDASISHPFATAAFRFGHTLIRRHFPRLNTLYKNQSKPVDLQENFNNMESIYDKESGGMDSILVGLLGTRCMAFDRHITDAVRNHLFQLKGWPLSGFDLISLNIMRARDHGVQPYNKFREFCGLEKAHSFQDLRKEMDQSAIEALESVYKHVDDVDLFPGLLSEKPMGGALMPPTMACLIAEQFQRLKKCDRFYYENDLAETRFSAEQLNEIRKITLGSILCQNGRMLTKIQPDVFTIPNDLNNAPVPCSDFPRLNLARWMDRPICYIGNSEVKRGATKLKSPCVRCTCTANGPVCRAIKVLDCQNLMEHFLLADIKADVTCVVQCAAYIKNAQ